MVSLVGISSVLAAPPGSSSGDPCEYSCTSKGGCEVRYVGHPRNGGIKGSCFPADFGGGCSGTPRECRPCNTVKTCGSQGSHRPVAPHHGHPVHHGHHHEGAQCVTVEGGKDVGVPCVFPFDYAGVHYTSCTTAAASADAPWCSTKVDASGKHMQGNWGNCPARGCGSQESHQPVAPQLGLPIHQNDHHGGDIDLGPREEEQADGCVTLCDNWPLAECKVGRQYGNGGYKAATCIAPYTGKRNHFDNRPQKFSNYPECASIPSGCIRCDEICARRAGKSSRYDY